MNASLRQLLVLLSDGAYHSGESMGDHLGVSRAAVWKQLKSLEELGLVLSSHKGMGYCIEGGLDLLDRAVILELYKSKLVHESLAQSPLVNLLVESQLSSTSQYLLELGNKGEAIHGRACFAETQSSGRGRRGRVWQSPFAANLYFSIGWRIENGVTALEGLSLAVGVALCEALEGFGISGVQLKWPNDLLYQGKKLGGILLEISGDAAGECNLVLGIGINITMPEPAARDIDQAWTDVSTIADDLALKHVPTRNQLAARFLFALFNLLQSYEAKGFPVWRERWQSLDANAGKNVVLLLGSKEQRGKVQGVDNTGALILRTEKGEERFIGGEISLRSQE